MAKVIEYEKKHVDEAQVELDARFPKEELKFVAFVIKIPESDEFLINRINNKDFSQYQWGKGLPMKAQRFTRLKVAQKIAKEIGKGATAEILFEGNTIFMSICETK